MSSVRKLNALLCVLLAIAGSGSLYAVEGESKIVTFDRAKLRKEALAEACISIRPGVPGKRPFWNSRSMSFIYAPAFEFLPVKGAVSYRFSVSAESGKPLMFEADVPWASLTPIWKDVPIGWVQLTVEGLDKKGGKGIGFAQVGNKKKRAYRKFERRVPFAGPYHEPAIDYLESGMRWLRWQSTGHYKKWKKEGKPGALGKYPCKEEAAAVAGLTALAVQETDPATKKALLQKAMNAARTLIKGSFPEDWGMAYMPPTYGKRKKFGSLVMIYPTRAAHAYLDLYEASKEKEFLDAVVRIADVYKRTQLDDGSWPILMEAESGKKDPRSKTSIMPGETMRLLDRLIRNHGMASYQPTVDAAWKWLEEDVLPMFRFEGQFEDTAAGRGGNPWHLSHHLANQTVRYILQARKDDPSSVRLAEEILHWSEDQFIFWEVPPKGDPKRFTPRGIEQHGGGLDFMGKGYNTEVSVFMSAFQALYELTGKEIYLAKAMALANAMTVLQKTEYGGNYVATSWGRGQVGGNWPNCHTISARLMVQMGLMLKRHKLSVVVKP